MPGKSIHLEGSFTNRPLAPMPVLMGGETSISHERRAPSELYARNEGEILGCLTPQLIEGFSIPLPTARRRLLAPDNLSSERRGAGSPGAMAAATPVCSTRTGTPKTPGESRYPLSPTDHFHVTTAVKAADASLRPFEVSPEIEGTSRDFSCVGTRATSQKAARVAGTNQTSASRSVGYTSDKSEGRRASLWPKAARCRVTYSPMPDGSGNRASHPLARSKEHQSPVSARNRWVSVWPLSTLRLSGSSICHCSSFREASIGHYRGRGTV